MRTKSENICKCIEWVKETHSSSTSRSAGDIKEFNCINNKESKTLNCNQVQPKILISACYYLMMFFFLL